MSEQQQDEQRGLTPRPNRILAEPATPEACAADLRSPDEQQAAAGAARDQAAYTRINAAPNTAAHVAHVARQHDQGERR